MLNQFISSPKATTRVLSFCDLGVTNDAYAQYGLQVAKTDKNGEQFLYCTSGNWRESLESSHAIGYSPALRFRDIHTESNRGCA